jgi:hypothetical protein
MKSLRKNELRSVKDIKMKLEKIARAFCGVKKPQIF